MTFNGALASTVTIHENVDSMQMRRFGESAIDRIRYMSSFTVDMQLMYGDTSNFADVISLFDDLYALGRSLLLLGEGWLCQGCGDYNPAGTMRCIKCGAPSKMIPFVRPIPFPFIVVGTSWSKQDPMGWGMVDLQFDSTGRVTRQTIKELLGSGEKQIVTMPNGLTYEYNYYLCRYCGMAVLEGKICSGCGGKRFPWHEIIRLERECVYCGTIVEGGIVCPGCATRIKGLTMEKVLDVG
jgi:hypothetical protein